MAHTPMAFTPATGLKDTTYSPTNAVSEATRRAEFQDLFDQLKTYLNVTVVPTLDTSIIDILGAGGASVTDDGAGTYTITVTGSGGDMLMSIYVLGIGQANTNTVDHALYADNIDIVQDTTPQAGGEFDFNGHSAGCIEYDNGNSGTSKAIDFRLGNNQKVTMTGNCTFTLTPPSKSGYVSLHIINDGTNGRTITLPTIKWVNGIAPTFTKLANTEDMINLFWTGTYYMGQYGLNFV